MAGARDVRELVERFEEIGDDSVRSLQPRSIEEIKPDRVNVSDGSSASWKRSKEISPDWRCAGLSTRPAFASLPRGRKADLPPPAPGSLDLSVQSFSFFRRPDFIVVLCFRERGEKLLPNWRKPAHQSRSVWLPKIARISWRRVRQLRTRRAVLPLSELPR